MEDIDNRMKEHYLFDLRRICIEQNFSFYDLNAAQLSTLNNFFELEGSDLEEQRKNLKEAEPLIRLAFNVNLESVDALTYEKKEELCSRWFLNILKVLLKESLVPAEPELVDLEIYGKGRNGRLSADFKLKF